MLKLWKETRFLNPRDNLNLYYDATPLFVANILILLRLWSVFSSSGDRTSISWGRISMSCWL